MTDQGNLRQLDELGALQVWEGVRARRVIGQRCMLAVVELEPNTSVPEHRHPHEQLGIVLRGGGRFRIGEEVRDVGPGSTWNIAPDVPHQFSVGPDGAVVIDVFAPDREDWEGAPAADDRAPVWP